MATAGSSLPLYGTLRRSPTGLKISRSTNLDDPHTEFKRNQWAGGFDVEHRFTDTIAFHSNTKWSDYDEKTPIGIYSGGGFINCAECFVNDPTLPSYYRTLQQYNFTYAEKVKSFATDNRFDFRFDTGSATNKLLAGVDYRNVRNKAAFSFVFAGQIDAFDPGYDPANAHADIGYGTPYNDQRLKQTGIDGQDQIAFGQLFVLLGGRYDWVNVNTFGSTQKEHKFTYRLASTTSRKAGAPRPISAIRRRSSRSLAAVLTPVSRSNRPLSASGKGA